MVLGQEPTQPASIITLQVGMDVITLGMDADSPQALKGRKILKMSSKTNSYWRNSKHWTVNSWYLQLLQCEYA